MLTCEQTRIGNFYRYPNGLLNVAWIAGFIRGVKPGVRMFYIQQTNNPDLMLPVHLRGGEQIPPRFKEKQLVRVICHIDGGQVEAKHLPGRDDGNGKVVRPIEPIARATAIRFDVANILDMPMAGLPDKSPETAARDEVDFRPFTGKGCVSGCGDTVRIAGIVQSAVMQLHENGEESDCCILLVRRTERESAGVPVRYYNKRLAKAVYGRIQCGQRIVIDAMYRVCAKTLGGIDPETGLALVVRYPYLHGIRPPVCPTGDDAIAYGPSLPD